MKPPKIIADDVSGTEVPNPAYEIWLDGVREIVDWLKERVLDFGNPIPVGDSLYVRFRKPLEQGELESKLKEWGVE